MNCIYEKKGLVCDNDAVHGSKYCHIKSHYPNDKLYTDTVNTIVHLFDSNRIEMDEYYICDVDTDGACCYRAIAQSLVANIDFIQNKKVITDYLERYNIDIELEGKKPLSYENETILAKYIQEISKQWLIENAQMIFPQTGETIEDVILFSHALPSIKIYDTLFSIFAGDADYINTDDLFNYDEDFIDMMGALTIDIKPKKNKKHILDRWGGMAEQFAISSYFGITIKVYTPERIDKRNLKIYQTTSRSKIAKLKLIQELTPAKNTSPECVELLMSVINGNQHYQVMFKKH
jgi:hypothetical protein